MNTSQKSKNGSTGTLKWVSKENARDMLNIQNQKGEIITNGH